MKQTLINEVVQGMLPFLDNGQIEELQKVLKHALFKVEIQEKTPLKAEEIVAENNKLVELFLSAKRPMGVPWSPLLTGITFHIPDFISALSYSLNGSVDGCFADSTSTSPSLPTSGMPFFLQSWSISDEVALRKIKSVLKSSELWVYVGVAVISCIFITFNISIEIS